MNFDTCPDTSPDRWGSFSCAIFDIDGHRVWMLGTCKCYTQYPPGITKNKRWRTHVGFGLMG